MSERVANRKAFVGRAEALDELKRILLESTRGHGGAAVITGEAGIGKTTLVLRLAEQAEALGIEVLWGSCWPDGGAPAMWPWVQILSSIFDSVNCAEMHAMVDGDGSELVEIVPSLGECLGRKRRSSRQTDPLASRFSVVHAVDRLLRRLATRRPLMLVVEDVHWADVATSLVLCELATNARRCPLIVVATLRIPAEGSIGGTGEAVSEFLRRSIRTLPLAGLGIGDIAELVAAADLGVDDSIMQAVFERTGGNPLFVTELLYVLRTRSGDSSVSARIVASEVPARVIDVVTRRVARLPAEVAALLYVGAVVGHDFDVAVLAAGAGLAVDGALSSLQTAVDAGIVIERQDHRFAFTHALLRDAVYESLPAGVRRRLHRDVLRATLAGGFGHTQQSREEALAYHAQRAVPLVAAVEAGLLVAEAGRSALAKLAYERAAEHFAAALDLCAATAPARERAGLLVELGHAQRCAGAFERARIAFAGAADALADSGPEASRLLVQAALGFASPGADLGLAFHADNARSIDLFERALAALPDTDSVERVALLARFAAELYFSSQPERSRRLADEAVEMARRIGDPTHLVIALAVFHDSFVVGQVPMEAALAGSLELLRHARRSRIERCMLTAHRARVFDLLVAGDIVRVDAEIAAFRQIADDVRLPAQQWWVWLWRAMRKLLDGYHQEAEEAAQSAFGIGEKAMPMLAWLNFSFLMFFLKREQGLLAELEIPMRSLALEQADVPAFQASLAMMLAELGHIEEAKAILDRLLADRCTKLHDRNWYVSWFQLARTAYLIEDAAAAADVGDLGRDLAGQFVMVSLATVCLGSIDLGLGWCADAAGDRVQADRWYRRAAEANTRVGARAWLAETRLAHAKLLARSDDPAARREAGELARLALASSETIGLPVVAASASATLAELAAAVEADRDLVGPMPAHACGTFRRNGSLWELDFGTGVQHLRHAKGLADIAYLLARPEKSIHAGELLVAQAPGADVGTEPAMAIFDERARREIQRRLAELQADTDEAQLNNDLVRAQRLEAERDFIIRELASATGLHGHARNLDDRWERARKTVTARIRNAIAHIDAVDPELARFLDRSIDTGLFCGYRPVHAVQWELQGIR